IEALQPDLVLAFSDLQADIAAELARRGCNVVLFNQRSVAEILQMIRMLGGLIGRADRAEARIEARGGSRADSRAVITIRETASRLFRRVGWPADFRHSV